MVLVHARTVFTDGSPEAVPAPAALRPGPEANRARPTPANSGPMGWPTPRLDDTACQVAFGELDSIAYYQGTTAGFEYDLWFAPTVCPTCTLATPFRLDSVLVTLVQADGAPADTAFLRIDIRCAALQPLDSCDGPGTVRGFRETALPLAGNSADGLVAVSQHWIALDSCWIDSPIFVRLLYLGNSDNTPGLFEPAFAIDGGNDPVIPSCSAWSNLSGALQPWNSVWTAPPPGYPLLLAAGTCNAQAPPAVTPCPALCAAERIGATATLYDPSISGVWAYFGSGQSVAFPFQPTRFECSLYWSAGGSALDSVLVTVSLGCATFNDICCAPLSELCSVSAWVQRGSANPFVTLPVSLDLSPAACCLPESFWVGATLAGAAVDDTLPSFLFSAASAEADSIPACEQWLRSNGNYAHMPASGLGWWNGRIVGSCGTCGELPPLSCPPPEPPLFCEGSTPINCTAAGVTFAAQTNANGSSTVTRYCGAPWVESGPEAVYSTSVGDHTSIDIRLTQLSGGDVDVFVLSACDAHACVAAGDSTISVTNLAAGIYYIVIDGRNGDVATFDMTISCCGDCPGQLCLADLEFDHPPGNRYYDGEFEPVDGHVHWSYYAGTGTRQHILRLDPLSCTLLDTIGWTASDASAGRALAFDPRSGGQYWTGTITNYALGTGHLYLISATGNVLQNFASIPGMISLRWAGLAFDAEHQRLWAVTRAAENTGADTVYCLDVSNPAIPILMRGPHRLTYVYTGTVLSAGGADFVPQMNLLLVGVQGNPQDFVGCFRDLDPTYSGPPPGPALHVVDYCIPDSNSESGFGVAALENFGPDSLGELLLMNYSDAAGFPQPHSVFRYPAPCALRALPCDSVRDLTCLRIADSIRLRFTSMEAGIYTVYSTTDRNTEELPPAAPWTALTSIELPANFPAEIMHSSPFGANYRSYRVVVSCP